MSFTTELLGLSGERVTAQFGEERPDCPHKGTDYSSSQTPKEFRAGVYGKVIAPTESGNWGTIAIEPFHSPAYTIQYIHCSAIYVGVGQIVYPWTVLGKTGDVAPPGTNISGIHLHLQVFKAGAPQHGCWGTNRDFIDPETWSIQSALPGVWIVNQTGADDVVRVETNNKITIMGDQVGAQVIGEVRERAERTMSSGELYFIETHHYWSGRISGLWNDGLQVDFPIGTCRMISNPPRNNGCRSLASTFVLKMLSANQVQAENTKLTWTKVGAVPTSLPEFTTAFSVSKEHAVGETESNEMDELMSYLKVYKPEEI